MINYIENTKTIIENVIESITCSVCKKTYEIENIEEIQEFCHINFTGGYGSVFGDMSKVQINICQHCLFEKLGEYAEYIDVF